jgi:hypothetical protein
MNLCRLFALAKPNAPSGCHFFGCGSKLSDAEFMQ